MTKAQIQYRKEMKIFIQDVTRSQKDEKAIIADLERRVKHHKARLKNYFIPTIANAVKTLKSIK
jgi:hypothetical protein